MRAQALCVLGPSAVGKSSITAAKASALFGSTYNGVVIDGALFREVHAGWKAVAVDGMEKGLLHADAWKLFKEVGTGNGGVGISGQLKRCAQPARALSCRRTRARRRAVHAAPHVAPTPAAGTCWRRRCATATT